MQHCCAPRRRMVATPEGQSAPDVHAAACASSGAASAVAAGFVVAVADGYVVAVVFSARIDCR